MFSKVCGSKKLPEVKFLTCTISFLDLMPALPALGMKRIVFNSRLSCLKIKVQNSAVRSIQNQSEIHFSYE
jgi:hypothetical protein